MGDRTEKEKMRALFEQIKPTIVSVKADLKAEYESLKAIPFVKYLKNTFRVGKYCV